MTAPTDIEALRLQYVRTCNAIYDLEESLYRLTKAVHIARQERERLADCLEASDSLRLPVEPYPFNL